MIKNLIDNILDLILRPLIGDEFPVSVGDYNNTDYNTTDWNSMP